MRVVGKEPTWSCGAAADITHRMGELMGSLREPPRDALVVWALGATRAGTAPPWPSLRFPPLLRGCSFD